MSNLFSRTRRKAGSGHETASAELLQRAGYVRQLASGIYSYLPLAVAVIRRIEDIIRSEMNAIGGQEVIMPVVNPAEIWKESGRWFSIDAEMGRFSDRSGREMVLAMTHEEVVADIVRNEVHSYRHFPSMIYHIQTKWRDDPRPRAGLIRVREFTMKDSYSLDADSKGMKTQYQAHYEAYHRIFARCGLAVASVRSDLGMMGGSEAHEFMYVSDVGEDTIVSCSKCDYTANRQIAEFMRAPRSETEAPLAMEKSYTPGASTIQALADYLDIAKSKLAKAVFLIAEIEDGEEKAEQFVLAMIRGDLEINETKLKNSIGARDLRSATEAEIRSRNIEPGYGSPIGAGDGCFIIVDESIASATNLVAGANEFEYHYVNVNYGREFKADRVADIAVAEDGFGCPACGAPLRTSRAVEVGNIFQLGTRYSDSMECTYLDPNGVRQPVYMGSYGIGVGRLLACIVEEHHDEKGIVWPASVAPYLVHIVNLAADKSYAENIYTSLTETGISTIIDDRDERAGVKFNDADLLGVPIRITLGERSLSDGEIEVKLRSEESVERIGLDDSIARLSDLVAETT